MTYAEQLKDPRWQKKRLSIFKRDKFACLNCGRDNLNLQVHHGYYEKGLMAWEYDNKTLHTLCCECHPLFEKVKNELYKEIAKVPISNHPTVYFNLVKLIIDKTVK